MMWDIYTVNCHVNAKKTGILTLCCTFYYRFVCAHLVCGPVISGERVAMFISLSPVVGRATQWQ